MIPWRSVDDPSTKSLKRLGRVLKRWSGLNPAHAWNGAAFRAVHLLGRASFSPSVESSSRRASFGRPFVFDWKYAVMASAIAWLDCRFACSMAAVSLLSCCCPGCSFIVDGWCTSLCASGQGDTFSSVPCLAGVENCADEGAGFIEDRIARLVE